MNRRVVITGIGPVTAVGSGVHPFWESILKKRTNIQPIPAEYEENYQFKSRYLVPGPEITLDQVGIDPSLAEIMEENAKLAVIAAKLALEDAGLHLTERGKYFSVSNLANCDIIIGVGMSSLQTAFNSYLAHLFGRSLPVSGQVDHPGRQQGPQNQYNRHNHYNRLVIPMLMPNSVTAWISILFGISGSNYTVNAACASGTIAIGEAYRRIKHGICNSVITGGSECLQEKYGAIMRGFDMLNTLTCTSDGYPRPFTSERSGFLFNEGAGCVLVLEELEEARRRGARIYAEVSGFEANSDANSIVQMDPSGEPIEQLLQNLIRDLPIDYLNTHGTGTVANDQIEATVIQRIFGRQDLQPYLNSTKSILGHSIGASGALEAAVTALSIFYSTIHGHIGGPMADLNLVLESMTAPIQYAVSTSYGFGGHNAALLLKRFEE